MMQYHPSARAVEDRQLLVDDSDEDATQLLTVICDGDPRNHRGCDYDRYGQGGAA